MAAHAMYASVEGTSALKMDSLDDGFSYVRGGRISTMGNSEPLFADDLRVACGASGLSEFAEGLKYGSSAGSDLLPSGAGACFAAGIASFVISLTFLLL